MLFAAVFGMRLIEMWNINSEPDLILAQTINRRLIIESIVLRGKTFFLGTLVLGICTVVFVLGLWVLSLAFRYSVDVTAEAKKISAAFVDTISKVVIQSKAEGKVFLNADPLNLSESSRVGVDPSAEVGVSANSVVTVSGNLKVQVPRPSERQLSLDRKGSDGEAAFTTYVVFHNESFSKGNVESRWLYDVSNQSTPKKQTCFYSENLGQGKQISFLIAVDGEAKVSEGFLKMKLNAYDVYTRCRWTSS